MNQMTDLSAIKLTSFSHGGGCGCKIAPGVLSEILSQSALTKSWPNLMVGTESSDDAAVYRLNDTQALIATTDFFMPIVDDPYDFGRIAATNALSDIYAMGGKPILALAIVGMPIDKLPVSIIQRILAGGEAVCAQAGIPVAGGHSIDSPEPIYGLVGLGLAHPDKIKRNDSARAGDALILGKGLGVGVLSAALKKGKLSAAGYQQMLESTTQLNTPGAELAEMPQVHALTDVTGFGLLGHLLEMCRGAKLGAEIDFAALPVLPAALELARQGMGPGAIGRNWAGYGKDVVLPEAMPEWQKNLLCDPQTSGGLLVACSEDATAKVLDLFRAQGFAYAAKIGAMKEGAAKITLR
ncbi:MAG: selenide, water dikinase SelD [Burkholderiales bacterium]